MEKKNKGFFEGFFENFYEKIYTGFIVAIVLTIFLGATIGFILTVGVNILWIVGFLIVAYTIGHFLVRRS